MDKYQPFQLTSVCVADLEHLGFDTTGVDDGMMLDIAGELSDDYCDQLFWSSLEVLADDLGIPKREAEPSE
jgi:hypothetical protein